MAFVELSCPTCRKRFRAAEEHLGRRGRCPACSTVFILENPGDTNDDDRRAGSDQVTTLLQSLVDAGFLTEPDRTALCRDAINPLLATDRNECLHILVKRRFLTEYQADRLKDNEPNHLLLGPYRILEVLHESDTCTVFLARHRRLDRLVALKELKDRPVNPEGQQAQFQREASALQKVNHPNIVSIYDARRVAGRQMLVLEYVAGSTVQELFDKHELPAVGVVCTMMRQIALGLGHMHDRGLIHGRIRPDNLIWQEDQALAKIVGFGGTCRSSSTPPSDTATPDLLDLAQVFHCLLRDTSAMQTPTDVNVRSPSGKSVDDLRPDIEPSLLVLLNSLLAGRISTANELASALVPYCRSFESTTDSRSILRQLGEYDILEQIGEGAFSDIFQARHRWLGRQVAIKILKRDASDIRAGLRWARECRILAMLNHPNIVAVYDADVANGEMYIVLELVGNQSLASLVNEQDHLPILNACDYARQAALALRHMHHHGVVHRDIKPGNLVVDDRTGLVKVVDLDLARVNSEVAESTEPTAILRRLMTTVRDEMELTRTAEHFGTPPYMPPEQWHNAHEADHRSDIYGLGCTLFQLLTGRPPFSGSALADYAYQHMHSEVQMPTGIPETLQYVLSKMLSKSPEDRYQSASDVALALEHVIQQIRVAGDADAHACPGRRVQQQSAQLPDSSKAELDACLTRDVPPEFLQRQAAKPPEGSDAERLRFPGSRCGPAQCRQQQAAKPSDSSEAELDAFLTRDVPPEFLRKQAAKPSDSSEAELDAFLARDVPSEFLAKQAAKSSEGSDAGILFDTETVDVLEQPESLSPVRPKTEVNLPQVGRRSLLQRCRRTLQDFWSGALGRHRLVDKLSDVVDCSVFAPPVLRVGYPAMVQVFVHGADQAGSARQLAREFDASARRRGFKSLSAEILRGSQLTFHLTIPSLQIDEPTQELTWWGRAESVQFRVAVPRDTEAGPVFGKVTVAQDRIPLGHVSFKLSVQTASDALDTEDVQLVGDAARRYRTAFISYSSDDRIEVLKRVQMLPRLGIRFYQDVLDLQPGERWERRLYRCIDRCDLFLLFWSTASKRSRWVRKEVSHALRRKAGDDAAPPEILPVIIEGPPPPEPFPELSHLHFNDYFLYFMNDGSCP